MSRSPVGPTCSDKRSRRRDRCKRFRTHRAHSRDTCARMRQFQASRNPRTSSSGDPSPLFASHGRVRRLRVSIIVAGCLHVGLRPARARAASHRALSFAQRPTENVTTNGSRPPGRRRPAAHAVALCNPSPPSDGGGDVFGPRPPWWPEAAMSKNRSGRPDGASERENRTSADVSGRRSWPTRRHGRGADRAESCATRVPVSSSHPLPSHHHRTPHCRSGHRDVFPSKRLARRPRCCTGRYSGRYRIV